VVCAIRPHRAGKHNSLFHQKYTTVGVSALEKRPLHTYPPLGNFLSMHLFHVFWSRPVLSFLALICHFPRKTPDDLLGGPSPLSLHHDHSLGGGNRLRCGRCFYWWPGVGCLRRRIPALGSIGHAPSMNSCHGYLPEIVLSPRSGQTANW